MTGQQHGGALDRRETVAEGAINPTTETDLDVLKSPDTGRRVIEGGTVRVAGYGLGVMLTAVASIFLLRHLGVVQFGRFITIMALIAIVTSISDAGLATIGQREYVLQTTDAARRKLVASMLAIRLLITPLGVVAAVIFALLAGYSQTMVLGTALAGIGLVIFMAQASLTVPLAAELRLVALTGTEVLRQLVIVLGYGLLVLAGASLLPFLAVQIPAAAAALVATALLVRQTAFLRPSLDLAEIRRLMKEALPMAVTLAVNVLYFRLLVVLTSLLVSAYQTGLFATSFRVIELMVGVPFLLFTVALPVLTRAYDDGDIERVKNILQSMAEVAFVLSAYLVLVIAITATPVIEIIGGDQYRGAAPVLRLQAVALTGAFVGQVWQLGLVAIHRQTALIVSSAAALSVIFSLAFWLIPAHAAIGAAAVAVAAEITLAAVTLLMLIRSNPRLMPNLSVFLKVFVAAGLATAPLLLSSSKPLLMAIVSTVIYVGAVLVFKAIPGQALEVLLRRQAGTATGAP